MSISICNHCENARPKTTHCRDCPLVGTCPTALKGLYGEFSQRFCPHMDHKYTQEKGFGESIVMKCCDFQERNHGKA